MMYVKSDLSKKNRVSVLLYCLLFIACLVLAIGITSFSDKLVIGGFFLLIAVIVGLLAPPEILFGITLLAIMAGSTYYWAREFYYLRFLFLGAFIGKGLMELAVKRLELKSIPVRFLVPMGAFSTFALSSTIYSINPSMTLQRAITLFMLIFAVGIYFWNYVDSKEKMERLITIVLGAVLVAIFISFMAWGLGAPVITARGRFRGLFQNPNTIGSLFVLTTLPLYWKYEGTKSWFFAIPSAGFIILLLFTASRASLLGVFISFIAYFLLTDRRKILGLLLVGILIFTPFLLIQGQLPEEAFIQSKIVQPTSLRTGAGRLFAWTATIDLFLQRPFLGYGFGAAHTVFGRLIPSYLLGGFFGGNPHNTYLDTLLESGVFGLLLLLLPIFWALKRGVELHEGISEKGSSAEKLNALMIAVVLGASVHSIFETWMTSVGNVSAVPFWLFVMLIFKLYELSQGETYINAHPTG